MTLAKDAYYNIIGFLDYIQNEEKRIYKQILGKKQNDNRKQKAEFSYWKAYCM